MSQGEGDRFTLLLLVVLKSASDVRLTTSLGSSHGPGARFVAGCMWGAEPWLLVSSPWPACPALRRQESARSRRGTGVRDEATDGGGPLAELCGSDRTLDGPGRPDVSRRDSVVELKGIEHFEMI